MLRVCARRVVDAGEFDHAEFERKAKLFDKESEKEILEWCKEKYKK